MKWGWLLLLLALPLQAQQVYKCRDSKGGPVYQSHPCEGKTAEKTWDAAQPEYTAEDIARIRRHQAEVTALAQRQRQHGNTYTAPAFSGPTQSQSKHARCQAAKNERARQLAFVKNAGIDLRQRLNSMVYDACK